MINCDFSAPHIRRILLVCTALSLATPSFADHMGPSGFGAGGGMSVFGPGTLDAGRGSAAFRIAYTRPERRSDGELAALAGQHIHAHNSDYNLNASLAFAYGVTHHLTVSAELPYVRRDDLREGTHGHSGGVAVNGVEELGTVAGIGDFSLLAKYRLTGGTGPQFAAIGGIKLPTEAPTGAAATANGSRPSTNREPGAGIRCSARQLRNPSAR